MKAEELQSEVINLPEKTEDMHLLLLTYREKLIAAKLAAEHHEDKRRQIRTELTSEIEALKGINWLYTLNVCPKNCIKLIDKSVKFLAR